MQEVSKVEFDTFIYHLDASQTTVHTESFEESKYIIAKVLSKSQHVATIELEPNDMAVYLEDKSLHISSQRKCKYFITFLGED